MNDEALGSDFYDKPSKSQRKRDMHALQVFGVHLVSLKPAKLATLPLSDILHTAILEAQKIRAHEAKRRQLQYIGKLMKKEDVDAIKTTLGLK